MAFRKSPLASSVYKALSKSSPAVCWDDRLSFGAIRAIYEKGLRIPQDIAIVGYDDIELAEYMYPPLTTVRQPAYQIGQTAVELLFKKLYQKRKSKEKKILLKPKLIIRSTT